jgi:hypothetical protein
MAVLCDESTDITVMEQLLIYVKYIDGNGETNVSFLGTEEVRMIDSSIHTVLQELENAIHFSYFVPRFCTSCNL